MITNQVENALFNLCKDRSWHYFTFIAVLHKLYVRMLLWVVWNGVFSQFVEGMLGYVLGCPIQTDLAFVGFELDTVQNLLESLLKCWCLHKALQSRQSSLWNRFAQLVFVYIIICCLLRLKIWCFLASRSCRLTYWLWAYHWLRYWTL